MGRGQTNTQTNTRTCRLLDQLGPEGRVGEKVVSALGYMKMKIPSLIGPLANLDNCNVLAYVIKILMTPINAIYLESSYFQHQPHDHIIDIGQKKLYSFFT